MSEKKLDEAVIGTGTDEKKLGLYLNGILVHEEDVPVSTCGHSPLF